MKAMVLEKPKSPLRLTDLEEPSPNPGQVLVHVEACAVCRTDLHLIDGELPEPKLPVVPGHEVIGRVVDLGREVTEVQEGDRVGVPWMASTCGICDFCSSGLENLCDRAQFTGYTADGGYAEYLVADARFCVPIPDIYPPAEAAPLLCAGLIGYRSLEKAGDARRLGIYGFGAAAHIVTQVAVFRGQEVYAFTRPGDSPSQEFALSMGSCWAGDSNQPSPVLLDAAIIFAPVGTLVPLALKSVKKGGIVVCGGIHMSDVPAFPYQILWGERQLVSVANLTSLDGRSFMELAPQIPVRTSVQEYQLDDANQALKDLRQGNLSGAAVLINLY